MKRCMSTVKHVVLLLRVGDVAKMKWNLLRGLISRGICLDWSLSSEFVWGFHEVAWTGKLSGAFYGYTYLIFIMNG